MLDVGAGKCTSWMELGGCIKTRGKRGRPGTPGTRAYSGDELGCAVDTLEKLCAWLVEAIPKPGLWAVQSSKTQPLVRRDTTHKIARNLVGDYPWLLEWICKFNMCCVPNASPCFLCDWWMGMSDLTNLTEPFSSLLHAATWSSMGTS